MIRIAVFSDSHGEFRYQEALLAGLVAVDWMLHAGDHIQDAGRLATALKLPAINVRAVVGNCDYPVREPAEQVLEIGGVRIWLTHGHRHGVKENLQRIGYRAAELGVRVAIFGHSHVPVLVEEGGVLLFNPGSMSVPRLAGHPPSCGLLEIDAGNVSARHLFAF